MTKETLAAVIVETTLESPIWIARDGCLPPVSTADARHFSTFGMCPDMDCILTGQDGCASQFCSFKTHSTVSGIRGRLRVSRCDCRSIEYEGKCVYLFASETLFKCGTNALLR